MRSFTLAVGLATSVSGAATFKYPTLGSDPPTSERTKFLDVCNPGGADCSTDDYGLITWLYADNYYDEWVTSLGSSKTETENTLVETYSNYTLRMECNITVLDGDDKQQTRTWFGCCLQDLSNKGGGFCHTIKTEAATAAEIVFQTQYLDHDQFSSVVYSDTTLDQIEEITSGAEGITYFKTSTSGISLADTFTSPDKWVTSKIQPFPAAAWSDEFRFEKDNEAMGYVHNNLASTNAKKWMDKKMTLNFSLATSSLSLALIASLIGIFAF